MLSGCPQTPPENVPGGTPETPPRDRPETPGRGPEKDHFEQLANNGRAVGDSSRKWRVETIHRHSPISLTLPLSWTQRSSLDEGGHLGDVLEAVRRALLLRPERLELLRLCAGLDVHPGL